MSVARDEGNFYWFWSEEISLSRFIKEDWDVLDDWDYDYEDD